MRITILAVPDCPNALVAAGRITAALTGRPASVKLVEVTGEAEAARLGMTGSPTILLDGVDPFAAAGAAPSVSCRIYRGPDGAADGAPSVQDLTAALSAAGSPAAAGDDNFFTSTASARTWAREHPDVTGNIVGQSRAEEIARQTFGALLAGD
jgi:hypothetical protein